VRLRDEPQDAHQLTVAAGAPADGASVADLTTLPNDAWISLIVRDDALLSVRDTTVLRSGDQVLVLGNATSAGTIRELFEGRLP
jgi:cell volume regulation protein A